MLFGCGLFWCTFLLREGHERRVGASRGLRREGEELRGLGLGLEAETHVRGRPKISGPRTKNAMGAKANRRTTVESERKALVQRPDEGGGSRKRMKFRGLSRTSQHVEETIEEKRRRSIEERRRQRQTSEGCRGREKEEEGRRAVRTKDVGRVARFCRLGGEKRGGSTRNLLFRLFHPFGQVRKWVSWGKTIVFFFFCSLTSCSCVEGKRDFGRDCCCCCCLQGT